MLEHFKCFNVKFYVCALVGMLIKWLYEMHGATVDMFNMYIECNGKSPCYQLRLLCG